MEQRPAGGDTDFGRVRRALLRQGEGDRVPFFELSIDKSIKSQYLGRAPVSAQDEVDFWRAAGYDFVSIRAGVRSVVRGLHPAVKEWLARRSERRDRRGQGGNASRSWVSSDGAILRTRAELADFPWPEPEKLGGYNDYAGLDEYLAAMRACLPPGMKLIVQLGYIFMGAWQLIGFENFCMQLTDDPGFVDEIVTRLATSQLGVLEILLQYVEPGAGPGGIIGAIFLPDDLCYNSGPVVAPHVYRRLIFPWYRRICDRCHAAGLPVGLHSDGDLTRLLPDLVKCGFDCLHPLEPPFNDIVAIKRDWGGQVALAGNIDLKSTLSEGTPEDVEREVKEKCALLAPGGGWLLGSSNSIPDFVPLENYRALLSAGLCYGRYGIREEEGQRATSGELAPGGGQ